MQPTMSTQTLALLASLSLALSFLAGAWGCESAAGPNAVVDASPLDSGDSTAAQEASAGDAGPDDGQDVSAGDTGPSPSARPALQGATPFDLADPADPDGVRVQPSVAVGGDGRVLVAWTGTGPASGAAGGDRELGIWAQMMDFGGTLMGAPAHVSAAGLGTQNEPSACALAGGGFALAWSASASEPDPDGTTNQIRTRLLDANGAPQGPSDSRLMTALGGTHWLASIACLAADDPVAPGGFAVAGVRPDTQGPGFRVFVQRFDSAGAPTGQAWDASDSSDGGQAFPAAAAGPAGQLLVAWEDTTGVGTPDEASRVLLRAAGPAGERGLLRTVAGPASQAASSAVAVSQATGAALATGTVEGTSLRVRAFASLDDQDGAAVSLGGGAATATFGGAVCHTDEPGTFGLLYQATINGQTRALVAWVGPDGLMEGPVTASQGPVHKVAPYAPALDYRAKTLVTAWTVGLGDGKYTVRGAIYRDADAGE